jgi:hypothetical protein
MKRKLFTLLLAFLAIAGFQAKAQGVVVTVATGDSTTVDNPQATGQILTNERGGYAGELSTTPNHLTVNEKGEFVYTAGDAKSTLPTSDRITVSNPAVNYVDFTQGSNKLTLHYEGVDYTRFVVFRSNGKNRVVNYSKPDLSSPVSAPEQVLTSVSFGAGEFEGYLGVQAAGFVDATDLLIVVHDSNGQLKLMPYGKYAAGYLDDGTPAGSVGTTTHPNLDYTNPEVKKEKNWFYPLYVKTSKLSGRWAKPEDFVNCKFNSFLYNGEKLTAYSATETEQGGAKLQTPYDVFTVTQVDYVQHADVAKTNNIITHNGGAQFQGLDYDSIMNLPTPPPPTPPNQFYGTASLGSTANVIPLFTLAATESDCKVLSVSRINDLEGQSEQDGVYANKLEVRKYAEYYQYDADGKYGVQDATGLPDKDYDTYTSLQKFAIWIDIDGNMVLYPAASYAWRYGEYKKNQADNIQPNAVLIYNNINVRYIPSSIYSNDPQKLNGVQIGWWKGGRQLSGKEALPCIATAPNKLQSITNYEPRPFIADPQCETTDLSGRFYFLQVYPDTTGLGKTTYPNVFGKDKYQADREYVLSVQVDDNAGTITKRLVALPKEEIRSTEAEYWRLPYDSVNMAAHWEVQAVKGSDNGHYRLINMLGDTLQYNVPSTTTSLSVINDLAGGYLQYNADWAGKKGASLDLEKYLGRPTDAGEIWNTSTHWFDVNAAELSDFDFAAGGTTRNVWKFNQVKGSSSFFVELRYHGLSAEVGLKFAGSWTPDYSVIGDIDNRKYYTQQLQLDIKDKSEYISYDAAIPNCAGDLMISLEPIYYVPKYGPFYPGDKGKDNSNGFHNTNDDDFLKQDSLTAYTFLEGHYNLAEADSVNNGLVLGSKPVLINDPSLPDRKVTVARLVNDPQAAEGILEFIPLNSALGNDRKALIKSCAPTGTYGIDTLHGETYKWYLVKLGTDYLTFDTVNYAGTTNREKVGLLFDGELANALPVRLYQPLVGDKKENNFLFQFYLPKYTYYPNATAGKFGMNEFPDIELPNLAAKMYGGGEVCFATLSNESNYIYATKARSGLTSGTRFHIQLGKPGEGCCPSEFIDPAWMAEKRLLSLPLKNQIWVQDNKVQAWIATGAKASASEGDNDKSAIVTNDGPDKATTLKHTYVASINKPNSGLTPGSLRISDGSTPISGFQIDLEVPLYQVQNADGQYLTVVSKSDMHDLSSTTPDVNGIKLEWKDKLYTYDKDAAYDLRALQLFAISGCKGIDAEYWHGKNFIYLPLASYQINYVTDAIVTDAQGNRIISYNKNLGKKADANSSNCPGNDVTSCYRISQYSDVVSQVKDLVVFNSSSSPGSGSLIPIEFRFQKQAFVKVSCDFQLVQEKKTGEYYTFDKKIEILDDYSWRKTDCMEAHWAIEWGIDGDDDLAKFKPELTEMYGTPTVQSQLTGKYYFIEKKELDNNSWEVKALDVSGYEKETPDYTANIETLTLTCVEHTVPFFDLEKDGGLNIFAAKLAILEAPFVDRNLTYKVRGDSTKIERSNVEIGWQTYITKIGEGFDNAAYLTVYRENRRALTEHHIIPYYSFSITTNEGKEYFLNVDTKEGRQGTDSVYWSTLTKAQMGDLLDYENQPNALKNFKFCLPYKFEKNLRAPKVNYGAAEYSPVYLQTLDEGKNDSPFLVIAGASTKYVTARKLDDAMKNEADVPTKSWNIYTVDYAKIDEMKVTSWIFGGETLLDNVWVPLADARNTPETTVEGVLTNQLLAGGGVTFVTESNASSVNYGIMGATNTNNLRFEFEGDTTIGNWAVRPIWYYRIQFGNDANKYLTDATGTTEAGYLYRFAGVDYPYAYFRTKLPNNEAYKAENIYADLYFKQTFGFRYVDPKEQSFYVVSNANYTDPKNETGYRFLASVNDHLVFVTDPKDAMVFQFGKKDNNGYTDLEVVGQGGIFGVAGGVKLLNTSGKVDIYSIDGRLIKSTVLTGSEEFITAPRGVVVVKNGSKVVKVVVR